MLSQGIIPALNVGCFPRFFADRVMLFVRNNGLISFPIVGENNRFVIREWYTIPEYFAGLFTSITTRISNDFSGRSAQCDPGPNFVLFQRHKSTIHPFPIPVFAPDQAVSASLQEEEAPLLFLLTKHSLFDDKLHAYARSHAD